MCALCVPHEIFPNYRSFAAHVKCKHKILREERKYIDNSAICPVCGVDFKSRWRVLEHIFTSVRSVKNRTYCIDVIGSGLFPVIAANLLSKYDAADRILKHQCKHKGVSMPPCKRPASQPPIVQAPTKRLRAKTAPSQIIGEKRFQIVPDCCRAAKVLRK